MIATVLVGFFLALFFRPYYQAWKRLVKNPTLSLALMLGSVLVPLSLVIWNAGAILVDQASNLIAQGPQLIRHSLVWFSESFPRLYAFLTSTGYLDEHLGEMLSKYGATAIKAGSGALKCLSGLLSALLTLFFLCFFLLKDCRGSGIVSEMPFLKVETQAFLAEQIDAFFDILVSFFQRQAVICLIEGCLYGTGFALVGLPYGFVIGLVLGILNLIPFFGTLTCLPVALLVAFFGPSGSLLRLGLVLAVWATGQALDGYVITPKIQGDKTGLGFAGVIFSFIFWPALLGPFLGLLLAIPLSAFCVVFWRALKSTYLTQRKFL